ncbi:enoyl-CoA hydratase isomerase family protein [Stagonosporopsis vannaccii]|nr:enoyl-CoA hydratase isomerase family protein [Stagonosporopsis vannaccii]
MSSVEADEDLSAVTYKSSLEGITIITIDRPARRNAVNSTTAQKLYAAFIRFEDDATQKICIFHGANGTFCAGADLQDLAKMDPKRQARVAPVANRNIGPMGPSRLQIKKPVICAVSGYAVAGGLELSLLGDIRVVEEDAVFGVFCRRFGVPLIDGGTVRLQAIVGLGRAMDMILTGRAVSAQEAFSMGLANRVVPKGKAIEEALQIAEMLLRFPNACMNADRDSCYFATYQAQSLENALQYEFKQGQKVIESESLAGARRFARGEGRSGKL